MVRGFWKHGPVVGIFAFEVACVMTKLLYLWGSLGDREVDRVKKFISDSKGLKKLVSRDADYIRGLIPGELFENMIPLTKFVARLVKNHCSDPRLKDFEHALGNWINSGVDPFGWEFSEEEMKTEGGKMLRSIKTTTDLYDQMKLLSDLECTRNRMDGPIWLEIQNDVELKQLEVENLKKGSFWNMTFDCAGLILARFVFTIFSDIKSVYGFPQLMAKDADHTSTPSPSIFNEYKLFDAPPDTLSAAALALKYADIVILIERLVRSPASLYSKRRDELYSVLPANIRAELRDRLPPIQRLSCSSAKEIAAPMKVTTAKTLEWLAPLAHNTKKWHSMWKRHQKAYGCNQVRLVETLYYAGQEETEAEIMRLIVGLQYKKQAAEMPVSYGCKGKGSVVLEESKSVTI